MYHTIGQRQGLGIGGLREFSDEPWFVAGKDLEQNVLVAVQGKEHPLLWSEKMNIVEIQWLEAASSGKFECTVKTRYRQDDVPCRVTLSTADSARATFSEPVWAVTPGQYAVFYAGDVCLGGGVIESAAATATREDSYVKAGSA
jgi:tRNA-specific 2-thiouridylase